MSKRKLAHPPVHSNYDSIATLDRFLCKASSDLEGRIGTMERKIHEGRMKLAVDTIPAPLELADVLDKGASQVALTPIIDNTLMKDIIFVPDTQLPCAQLEPGRHDSDLDMSGEPDIYIPPTNIEPDTKRQKGGGNAPQTYSFPNQSRKKTTRGKGKVGSKLIVTTPGKSRKNRTPARVNSIKLIEGRKTPQSFSPMAPPLEHIGNTLSAILDRLQHIEGRLDRLCTSVKTMEIASLTHHPCHSPSKHLAPSVSHHSLSGPAITNLNVVSNKVIANAPEDGGGPQAHEPIPTQGHHHLTPLQHSHQPVSLESNSDSGVPNQGIPDSLQGGVLNTRFRCLDLPPAAAPLVIVLANVPSLKPLEKETSLTLIYRVTRWMNRRLGLNNGVSHGIIMAERVSWLGHRPKTFPYESDCIVLNFRARHLVDWTLSGLNQFPEEASGIQVLPFGYFYPSAVFPTHGTHPVTPFGRKIHTGLPRGIAGLPASHPLYTFGPPLCLTNRFAPLMDLNSLD